MSARGSITPCDLPLTRDGAARPAGPSGPVARGREDTQPVVDALRRARTGGGVRGHGPGWLHYVALHFGHHPAVRLPRGPGRPGSPGAGAA